MRVTLVGGGGFLGLSIARALRDGGADVAVVDRPDRLVRNQADLEGFRLTSLGDKGLDDVDLNGEEVLVYLASSTLPSTSMISLSHDAEANIIPALRTFERARDAGVRRIVFASSGGTVYGVANQIPIPEGHDTAPISAYGVSKLAIERYLALMARSGAVEAISLRVANPYGPYQFRGVGVGAVARFVWCAHAKEPIEIWGDGTVVRDYIYVDDVADAFALACLRAKLPSGEYNIGSGEAHSLNDVISKISSVCKVVPSVAYRASRTFDVPEVVLDCSKFRSATGWRPVVDFSDGLSRMWNCLQS